MSENDLIRRGDALDAISGDFNASFSAIAALPARGVGVKPLVWRDGKISAQSVRETAETPFGTYEVLRWSTGDFGGSMPGAEGYEPTEYGDMASLEAAKAAAQANYEARILAALEVRA